MPDPANDPGPAPNGSNALLHFPLRSDADETDTAAAAAPPRASAGGWNRTTMRAAWLGALLAIVLIGSAVAFLMDDAGAPGVDGEVTVQAQPRPEVETRPEAPSQTDAEAVQEPVGSEPADATETPGTAAEPDDPAPVSDGARETEVESSPAAGEIEATTEEEATAAESEPAEAEAAEDLAEAGGSDGDVAEDALVGTSLPGLADWPRVAPYTVQPGDRASHLAERFATTVEAVVALNGLADAASLTIGAVLLIPYGYPDAPDAIPHFRILNPATLPLLWDEVAEWTTAPGDTLRALAVRFDTTVRAIEGINGLEEGATRGIGQALVIAVGYIPPTFDPG